MNRRISGFLIVKILLIVLIVITFVYSINLEPKYNVIRLQNNFVNKYLFSDYIEVKTQIDTKENILNSVIETDKFDMNGNDVIVKGNETSTVKKEEKMIVTDDQQENNKEKKDIKNESIGKEINSETIETITGALAGYGPDCYGCTSFKTASGRYIGDGKIYYEDKTYGTVRIVAGDKKYPFGTIVKISNLKNNEVIYAIVLDRGFGVGIDKKFTFDLLFETERQASDYGSRKNVTFEIKRLGY